MDEDIRRAISTPSTRSQTYRVLILAQGERTSTGPMEHADIVLRPLADGNYQIVKHRYAIAGAIISAQMIHELFGIR